MTVRVSRVLAIFSGFAPVPKDVRHGHAVVPLFPSVIYATGVKGRLRATAFRTPKALEHRERRRLSQCRIPIPGRPRRPAQEQETGTAMADRKSTRLNSSH